MDTEILDGDECGLYNRRPCRKPTQTSLRYTRGCVHGFWNKYFTAPKHLWFFVEHSTLLFWGSLLNWGGELWRRVSRSLIGMQRFQGVQPGDHRSCMLISLRLEEPQLCEWFVEGLLGLCRDRCGTSAPSYLLW